MLDKAEMDRMLGDQSAEFYVKAIIDAQDHLKLLRYINSLLENPLLSKRKINEEMEQVQGLVLQYTKLLKSKS